MQVPHALRRAVIAWFGDEGRRWCDTIPSVAARLIDKWMLRPDAILPGGTHALVLACTRADGTPAVLKLPFVDDENRAEAQALDLYDGNGAVRLLDHDPACGALLLERLLPGTSLLELSDRLQALDITCGLLRRLRRPPPKHHPFPLLRDLAPAWEAKLSGIGRDPFAHAAARLRSLGTWQGEDFVVNRDAHFGNVLSAGREPWLLIDPKPVVGDPAFDGAFLLLQNLDRPTPEPVDRIARGLAVDAGRLRDWALVRAVDNILWSSDVGDTAGMARHVAAARRLGAMG